MPFSLSFEEFPDCPKCGEKTPAAKLLPIYGARSLGAQRQDEDLYWSCSNCGLEVPSEKEEKETHGDAVAAR